MSKQKTKLPQKKQGRFFLLWSTIISSVFFYSGSLFAASTAPSLGGLATTVTGSFSAVAKLITACAYVAGMGFALSAILKFKQHKDNPTQIPVGTPIALLFIAAALIFLPTIFGVAGQTLFGGSGSMGGVSGTTG